MIGLPRDAAARGGAKRVRGVEINALTLVILLWGYEILIANTFTLYSYWFGVWEKYVFFLINVIKVHENSSSCDSLEKNLLRKYSRRLEPI